MMNMEIYIFIGAVVLLIFVEIFLVLRRRKKFSKRELALIKTEWESIRNKISREPKHALIEADRLLDFVLKKRGYEGSLGDKLKSAVGIFTHGDDVWKAHKLRNRAVHEVGFAVTEGEARKALSSYKQALWDLGIRL